MSEPIALTLPGRVATDRLIVRALEREDAEALLAYRRLPEVTRHVPFAPMSAEVIAERFADRWSQTAIVGEGNGLIVGIERADSGELIGDLALMLTSDEHQAGEIGWLLHPAHGGRGYATEAARAGLAVMFAAGLHRIVARVDSRNTPSLRLCERIGMRREAVLRENEWFKGEWTDEVDYALLREEWRSSSPAATAIASA